MFITHSSLIGILLGPPIFRWIKVYPEQPYYFRMTVDLRWGLKAIGGGSIKMKKESKELDAKMLAMSDIRPDASRFYQKEISIEKELYALRTTSDQTALR